jgi:hypothetical protein
LTKQNSISRQRRQRLAHNRNGAQRKISNTA